MAEMMKYSAARQALAEAVRVDEVKSIRDKAVAMQVYAQQAKDPELIEHATEIRKRAEIRAGELLREMAEQGQRHTGKNEQNLRGSQATTPVAPTLTNLGVSKSQSSRWQQMAALPKEEQEGMIERAKKAAANSIDKTKNAPRAKGGPRPERRTIAPEKVEQIVSLLDEGKTYGEVEKEVGVSNTVVRRVAYEKEAKERAFEEGKAAAEIDPSLLAMSAQQKLEAAIRQATRRLEAEYEQRVQDGIRQALEDTVLPHYNKKMDEYDEVIRARKGVLTTDEFRLILSCLHPDQSASEDRIREAFNTFKSHEIALRGEKEMPTAAPALPRNWEELQKARAEVKARRKRQSNGVQVHH